MARKSKTRKVKKGGQKKNQTNYNPTYITQTAGNPFTYNSMFNQRGGAPAPAPSNACQIASNLPNLDEISLISSLQTYGDTLNILNAAAISAQTAATSAQSAVSLQQQAAGTLQDAVNSINNAFIGTSTTKGLYMSITGTPFVPSPLPALSPAPAPA